MPSVEFNSNVVKKVFHNSNVVKKLFLNGAMVWQDAVLPVGIIIGFTGTVAPNGWTLFNTANDKLIVGAGGTYITNTSGGSNTVTANLSTDTAGSHSATYTNDIGSLSSGYGGLTASGGHTHTITVSGTITPYRHQIGFIKATQEGNLPMGGIIFSAIDLSSVLNATNVNTTSAYLSANASNRALTGSSGNITLSGTSTASGGHNHGSIGTSGGVNQGYANNFGTTHTHTVSVSIAPNIKSKYLTAWANALNEISICPNVIGMWEGSIPPDGWAICNGTNGTPDLRDYFIRLGDKSVAGTVYNSSSSTSIPATATSSAGSHAHSFGVKGGGSKYTSAGHTSTAGSHAHTTVASSITIELSYYALTFIMKLP